MHNASHTGKCKMHHACIIFQKWLIYVCLVGAQIMGNYILDSRNGMG